MLRDLVAELRPLVAPHYPPPGPTPDSALVITCNLDLVGTPLSLYTTLTTFGAPRDVTLDELLIELFFPADEQTEATLTALGA